MGEDPLLGLATTEQLLRELICRFRVHYPHDPMGMSRNTDRALILGELIGGLSAVEREYRTVDPDEERLMADTQRPVNERPPRMIPSAANWWLCERCHYSALMPANSPAPVCPECASAGG